MKAKRKLPGKKMMLSGLLLLATALLLSGYNIWTEWKAGVSAHHVLEQMEGMMETSRIPEAGPDPDTPDYILNPNMELPQKNINGKNYVGILELPSLRLTLPVLGEYSLPDMAIAPCRYAGTAYRSGFVVAGHNYRTHFGSLNRLETGDPIYFTDMNGNGFVYHVAAVQVLGADGVEEMLSEEWDLTLFTCTYSGQTRFTVRCLAEWP